MRFFGQVEKFGSLRFSSVSEIVEPKINVEENQRYIDSLQKIIIKQSIALGNKKLKDNNTEVNSIGNYQLEIEDRIIDYRDIKLTVSEEKVAALMSAKYREKEIASRLNISVSTVKKHKNSIRKKATELSP